MEEVMEETISLQDIVELLKKRIVLIITTAFICLGIAAVATFVFITPKFSSSAQMIVKLPQAEGQSTINDVNFNLQMINTYKELITTNVVLEEVHDNLVKKGKYSGTVDGIKKMLTVNQEQNSQIFSITATSPDPYESEAVANTVATVFQKQAKDIIDVDKITILAKAEANVKPVSPNNKLNLLIGAILGIAVGIGLAFLFEFLDKTVKDDKFVKDVLVFPMLGTVPQMTAKELSAKIVKEEPTIRSVDSNDENTDDIGMSRRTRKRV